MSLNFFKKNKYIFLGILTLTGFGLYKAFSTDHHELGMLKKGPLIDAVYGIGSVESHRSFDLRIGQTLSIDELYVREGDSLKKGDKLLIVSGNLFRAPFDGTVTSVPFQVGETVFPNAPLVRMVDMKNLYLRVVLDQDAAIRIKKGQKVRAKFDALANKLFYGKVRNIFPSQSQFVVQVDMDSLSEEVLPGMSADVALEVGIKDNVLLAPAAAYQNQKLMVIRGRKLSGVDIKVGLRDGEWIEVIEGDVKEGEMTGLLNKGP